MAYSINNAQCICTFFCPTIYHDPSFHCSLFLTCMCELLLLMSYCFSVSLLHTFSFLVTPLPMCHLCPDFVVYHYHISPMYIHCHHHFVLTSFFFIILYSMPFFCLLMIILLLFFSFCVVFLCHVFYVVVHLIFLLCTRILLLYIYMT